MAIFLILLVLSTLIIPVIIYHPVPKFKQQKADCIIILGFSGREDSKILHSRVEAALLLFNAGMANYIICSGGDNKYGENEAVTMQAILIELGVNPEYILLENEAKGTYANMEKSKAIMKKHQFENTILVTSRWHQRKSSFYAARYGIPHVTYSAKTPAIFVPFYPLIVLFFSLYSCKNLIINKRF